MGALWYLQKTMLKNRVRKALKRPVTYVYLVLGVAYLTMILYSFGPMIKGMGLDSEKGLVGVLTVIIFLIMPANLISYAKRTGLLFRQNEVQFVFTAPMPPKMVLLYAQAKQILLMFFLGSVCAIGGCLWFKVSPVLMFIYFLLSCIVENTLEASLVVLLYGNERVPEKVRKTVPFFLYGCMAAFVVIGYVVASQQGISLESVLGYLFTPAIQWVPIVGWNIAVIHLLFLGPTTTNMICSILYFISVVVFFVMAKKMKCQGEYYEDAMKFADDYAQVRQRSKKGEVSQLGKKKKYGKASIVYKGYYAKAIFYRQLLEYKKNRFFMFGMNSLLMAGLGIGIVVLTRFQDLSNNKEYLIPGVMAYVIFIFSGYATKWSKELESPYTYMIPDTPFRKLWYATLTEHIRSFVDACLITIPGAIALRLSLLQAVLIILIYVCLQANKLYLTVLAEGLLGDLLGQFGKQMLRMLLFAAILGVGIVAAVIGTLLLGVSAGFFSLIIVTAIMTLGCMFAAAGIFEKMEALN